MSTLNQVIEDTLTPCRTPLTATELFQSCAADGLPVTYHQCKQIAKLSEECIRDGGWYNILSIADGNGNVVNFFNSEGELLQNYRLRRPEISRDRKIPTLNWLRDVFEKYGYDKDRLEVKYIHRIIDSHIRDGGSWTPLLNDHCFVVDLKMNGVIKGHFEFHRENLE